MPIRILHFADVHLDDSTLPNSLDAMWKIATIAGSEKPDLIVNAGDLAMRRGHLPPWVAFELRAFHTQLAKIAPVIVVEGNHDQVHDSRAGTLEGALALAEAPAGRLHLATRPQVILPPGVPIAVACLPYPSRKRLLETTELVGTTANATAAALLHEIIDGLAVGCPDGKLAILVFHGTLDGSKLGDERMMTTEMDALLDAGAISERFSAVLCGHIHRPQAIGDRAWYSGSPAPLGFSEETYDHGVTLWTYALGPPAWTRRFIPIEPAQRLLTIDLRDEDEVAVPDFAIMVAVKGAEAQLMPNTRLRVLVRLGRHEDAAAVTRTIEEQVQGITKDVRVVVERREADLATAVGDGVTNDGQIDAMLDLWAERSPEARVNMPTLRTVAALVEARLPYASRNARNAAEYTLESLELSNWKSYGPGPMRLDLQALGRLVVIEGENASGKSNLMEAEAFALWGRTVRGRQTLAELIRKGATDATVRAVFRSGGEHWRITRMLRVRSTGAAAQDLILEREVENGWISASEGTATETEARIQALVGPLELYLSTRFASQGDIDRILSLSPAELKETLQAALNTEIFGMREREVERELAAALEQLRNDRATFDVVKAKADMIEEQRGLVLGAMQVLATEALSLQRAREEQEQSQKSLGAAEAAMNAIAAQVELFQTWENTVRSRAASVADLDQRRAPLQEAVAAGDQAQTKITVWDENRQRIAALEQATEGQRHQRIQAQALVEAAAQAQAQLARAQREAMLAAGARGRLQKQVADARVASGIAANAAVSEAERELDRLITSSAEALNAIEARAKRADLAPFGEKCLEAMCPLLGDAIKARGEIDPHKQWATGAVGEVNKRIADAQRERVAILEKDSAAHAELRREHDEARWREQSHVAEESARFDEAEAKMNQANALLAGESDAERELRERRAVLAATPTDELLRARARGAAAADRLASLTDDLKLAQGELASARASLDRLGAMPKKADEEERLTLARMRVDLARQDAAAADGARMQAATELAQAQQRLADSEEATAKLSQLSGELQEKQHRANVADLYRMAVGKNGLPYMILERSLPSLERHANAFLGSDAGDVDLRVEIEPFREIGTGERRTEVMIRYRNRFGLHALAAASGFERAALGYALRAAMAQVQAEAHGIKVTHFIADEGWGAFDERNLLMGQHMLQRMAEQFRQVVFISHVGTIREIAESRVLVTASPDGSLFEVAK